MGVETDRPNRRALDVLKVQYGKGMLPHAHLFAGPSGVGRMDAARSLARLIFCGEDELEPCEKCSGCRAFMRGEHPDYREFSIPEGRQSLPIEAIRELQLEASRKPFMGRVRVFVIRDAELMSMEAANCFLKTLEEPPGECYFILIAESLHELPETIVSRCQVTKLAALHPGAVTGYLAGMGVDESDAAWCAMRSWGSPGRAEEFCRQKMHEFNDSLVSKILEMRPEDNFEISDFVQKSALTLGSNASEQRKAAQELLECLAMIYRDTAVLVAGLDNKLFNEKFRVELKKYAAGVDMDFVLDCADRVLLAIERIGLNANRRIVFDSLFSSLDCPEP